MCISLGLGYGFSVVYCVCFFFFSIYICGMRGFYIFMFVSSFFVLCERVCLMEDSFFVLCMLYEYVCW